jgi:hypothetical protein
MIECPACGEKYRPGTLFCSECGEYLVTGGTLQTDPLPEDELPESKASPWASESDAPADTETPLPLRIKIESSGRQVELPSNSELLVGRLDADNAIFPDLDLTSDYALQDGISRRHCVLHLQGTAYLVEDLGSSNGTYLNGKRLTPHLLHVLKDGDELQLGRAVLTVIIQE